MNCLLQFVSSVLLIFGGLATAQASPRCETVFAKKQRAEWAEDSMLPSPYGGELDPKILKKYKFEVQNGVLWDLSGKEKMNIGNVRIYHPHFLYQWADKEYHDSIIERGGIDAEWMNEILQEPGQMAGKGFYVSLHPGDSRSYGDTATVFHPHSALIIVEGKLGSPAHWRMSNDLDLVRRMAAAGTDGYRHETLGRTWLALISSRSLVKPTSQSPEHLNSIVQDAIENTNMSKQSMLFSLFQSKPMSYFLKFRRDTLIYRLAHGETLNAEEIIKLQATLWTLPNDMKVRFSETKAKLSQKSNTREQRTDLHIPQSTGQTE